MNLRDAIVKLGDEHPEFIPDLLPVLALATGVETCCRKVAAAPESEVRKALIRLAYLNREMRPHLLAIIPEARAPSRHDTSRARKPLR